MLGIDGHPGTFGLARGGLYVRELDAWIIFILFKGVDIHSGTEAKEDKDAHNDWISGELDAAWKLAGPQNRVGYVNYLGRLPSHRLGSMSTSPPTGFGNYSVHPLHKAQQQNFASHGGATLGPPIAFANRMAREAIYDFHNSLCLSGLDLNMDLNDLMEAISFKDPDTDAEQNMERLPFNPLQISESFRIRRFQAFFQWYLNECSEYYIRITKEDLSNYRKNMRAMPASRRIGWISAEQLREHPESTATVSEDIVEVVSIRKAKGKVSILHHFCRRML